MELCGQDMWLRELGSTYMAFRHNLGSGRTMVCVVHH